MRSSLVKRRIRSCPICAHPGFAKIGTDFYGRPEFECNACRHVWSADHGPTRGTSLDRVKKKDCDDEVPA